MPIILLIVIACTRHFSRFRLRSYGLQPGSFLCPLLLLLLSHSVMSDSLRPHRLQHTRLPCPSPSPGACSNSCLSSWWRHSTVSSSVVPFSSCLQPFPASGSFQMVSSCIRWPKYWSFSFSIIPSSEYAYGTWHITDALIFLSCLFYLLICLSTD